MLERRPAFIGRHSAARHFERANPFEEGLLVVMEARFSAKAIVVFCCAVSFFKTRSTPCDFRFVRFSISCLARLRRTGLLSVIGRERLVTAPTPRMLADTGHQDCSKRFATVTPPAKPISDRI